MTEDDYKRVVRQALKDFVIIQEFLSYFQFEDARARAEMSARWIMRLIEEW